MSAFRLVYFAHSVRSDWNNGNAHFLRGLLRDLQRIGHAVTVLEPADSWSYTNLLREGERGERSLAQFHSTYPDLVIRAYSRLDDPAIDAALRDADIVIIHEWNEPSLIARVLASRERFGFRALFHDTHHRASSSPEQLTELRITEFDGILAFGKVLETIYRERWGAGRVWTLHEGADVEVFTPHHNVKPSRDLLWIGNWGDGERSEELAAFLLEPARLLRARTPIVHGVRYPEQGVEALQQAGIDYGGYLANLDAPAQFATALCTVHVPRRQYAEQLPGIPTIRVFEALACGIPLVSAPWQDCEELFREGDFLWARDSSEMTTALRELLRDSVARAQQAAQGLAAVQERHTTHHRAEQLSGILEEVLQ